MKIYFDTEFTGLHQNTTLISIGMVSEDGRTFYAEFEDYDRFQVDTWIEQNVIKNLCLSKECDYQRVYTDRDSLHVRLWSVKDDIAYHLAIWLEQFDQIEMWSDCLAYDWILFRELLSNTGYIWNRIYYIPFDISTLFKFNGIDPDINREEFAEIEGAKHNALHDAKVIKACWKKLTMPVAKMQL